MIKIKNRPIKNNEVFVPGSKSYTHRILIAAALADGKSIVENCLNSQDTGLTLETIRKLGVKVESGHARLIVYGRNGIFGACKNPIDLRNSGTSMRLLTAVLSLGKGIYTLTGTKRMKQRPINDLLDGLRQIGIDVKSLNNNGCPPVQVRGGKIEGGHVFLNCKTSSQYLSAMLLMSPLTENGLSIEVVQGPVSKPYVDMTLEVMAQCGIEVERQGYKLFFVPGNQKYRSGNFVVEPDCSQAGYFWAAAAINDCDIMVKGISSDTNQGDVRFVNVLKSMGCGVLRSDDGITVHGGDLRSIEVDMSDMPDLVPTLAVVAAFAKGTTVVHNVSHLKAKESNRLQAVVKELAKMGINASYNDTALFVEGGDPHGAKIETYDDHRIAMSFAIAGLRVPGVFIGDEKCVEKSFPEFWNVLNAL